MQFAGKTSGLTVTSSPDAKESLFLKVQRSLVIFTIVHGESLIKIPLNSFISGFPPTKK
jgi:hypothetical protein